MAMMSLQALPHLLRISHTFLLPSFSDITMIDLVMLFVFLYINYRITLIMTGKAPKEYNQSFH